ncbi:MAG: hypothetical protein KIT69_03290, partial [Propionibacteriaceae bacterium]|nr:hypothetical protein [Propionibacteriaceae bacterium]
MTPDLRRGRARRRLPGIAAILATAALLAACATQTPTDTSPASTSPGSSVPAAGGNLVWAIASEPSCFAPAYHQLISDRAVLRNLFDSLVHQEADGTFTPWLASAWTISDDATTYTFTLRDDVVFSDGVSLDAQAVVDNLDWVRNPDHGSTYGNLLTAVQTITATDASTVTFQLAQPDSALLENLSSLALAVVSPTNLDSGDALCDPGAGLAGSGPFTVQSYTRGESVRLARNEAYVWAPESQSHDGPAYLETVEYRFIGDAFSRVGALTSGEVNAISGVPAVQVSTIEATPDLQYLDGPMTSSTFGFVINADSANAPWDDVRLRRALRDGFDLDAIVQAVYGGEVQRAWSWVGADSPEFDDTLANAWGNDIEGANGLLDEAGWTARDADGYRTRDGQRLVLKVTYDSDSVRDQRDTLIEAVQDQLATNVGIDLQLTTPPWTEVSASIADGSWSVYP